MLFIYLFIYFNVAKNQSTAQANESLPTWHQEKDFAKIYQTGIILDNRTGNQCRFELSVQSRAEKIRQISDQYPSLNISLS